MSEIDVDKLIHQLFRQHRRKVIASLMAGNDTCCFTTEQYIDRWVKIIHKGDQTTRWMVESVARTRHLPPVCQEVKPDLWTPKP